MKRYGGDIILLAVVGMSPAVLTETVWALAHEKEPVIPDRVVVLTTSDACGQIVSQLFDQKSDKPGGWKSLRRALEGEGFNLDGKLKFGNTGDSIRVFTDTDGIRELADIATSEDNAAAADFMLRHLREFISNPANVVIASIAGGRKTMSALMISCMSLLGREQDRVCHVLVNPPFDGPLNPPFLFPVKGLKHKNCENKSYTSVSAVIELTDVPFVRMLGWYNEKFKTLPPKYSQLVAGVQRQVPTVHPLVTLDMKAGRVLIEGAVAELSPTEFMVFYERCVGNTELQTIGENLMRYKSMAVRNLNDFYSNFKESSRFNQLSSLKEDVSRCDSASRRKLKATALAPFIDDLIPKRNRVQSYPKSRIKIKGKNPFMNS